MVDRENQQYPYTWPCVRIPRFLERVGQTHIRCGNRTDLAPIPSPSITIVARKRKFVKKSGRSSVVPRTLPVLQFLGSGSSVL